MELVVRTFLRNNEGKYLMVKHNGKKHWSLPGGHMKKGETIYKTIKREIREELNLEINILGNKIGIELEGIIEKPQPLAIYKVKYCTLREKEVRNTEYIFLSEIKDGEIKKQKSEIKKYDFFTKDEIINIINTFEQVKFLAGKLD